jgi:hypothetical protein
MSKANRKSVADLMSSRESLLTKKYKKKGESKLDVNKTIDDVVDIKISNNDLVSVK